MKRQIVMNTLPPKCKRQGRIGIVQVVNDTLILNIYSGKKLTGRYCIRENGEYEYFNAVDKTWGKNKLRALLGGEWYCGSDWQNNLSLKNEDSELIKNFIKPEKKSCKWGSESALEMIASKEDEYYSKQVQKKYASKERKRKMLMDSVPDLPEDFNEWIRKQAAPGIDYLIYNKEDGKYSCTACGSQIEENQLQIKPKHGKTVICPKCGAELKVKKIGNGSIEIRTNAGIVQKTGKKLCVIRHFDVVLKYKFGQKHSVKLSEAMRVFPYEREIAEKRVRPCQIYYNQNSFGWDTAENGYGHGSYPKNHFDQGNRGNRHATSEYMYPNTITAAFEDTAYMAWGRIFEQMSAAGIKLNYNLLMMAYMFRGLTNTVEYLFKGRFYRLLTETTEDINVWNKEYIGVLHTSGESINEVFGIKDSQIINRIRDMNGGENTVEWMRCQEETKKQIPQETLNWLSENNLWERDLKKLTERMSVQQAVNYLIRQQKESYHGKSFRTVIEQYEDYMDMCKKLNKKLDDEMIFKPRELKKRHDDAAETWHEQEEEIRKIQEKKSRERYAKEMSDKYPEVEKVLKEVKSKLEYTGENYRIVVPKRIIDIQDEGRFLHHCCGASDRYFDRIAQHETYICFLRKNEKPGIPYYTIEVEPGGTIRQHRSMHDEEPNINEIKGFLKEWQKVIRQRMTLEDKKKEKISKQKREANMKDLQEKRNTRVINGLLEDFMEAMEA